MTTPARGTSPDVGPAAGPAGRDAAPLVVVRGGGDLGTGVAHTLHLAGYRVMVLETARPRAVRRAAAFAQAVYDGSAVVDGVRARLVSAADAGAAGAFSGDEADRRRDGEAARSAGGARAGGARVVPVVVDPDGAVLRALRPSAVVDARMAKRNLGTARGDAPVTIALGPGFVAGRDVDAVIETNRGPALGRVIDDGAAEPDTGVPAAVGGVSGARVVRAPAAGAFEGTRRIGDLVREGDEVGRVAGRAALARTSGLLRGIAADGLPVREGDKVGDVDPRGIGIDPEAVSDKARAVGRAVLAALRRRG